MRTLPVNNPCRICRDRKTIKLAAVDRGHTTPVFEEFKNPRPQTFTQESYPCPACATPQNKIAIAQGRAEVSTGYSELAARASAGIAAKKAVEQLVDFLVRENVFTFKIERAPDGLSIICVAELGVVTDRFAELRSGFVDAEVNRALDAVTSRAAELIQVWGSESRYASDRIEKSRAVEFIAEARKNYGAPPTGGAETDQEDGE